MKTIKIIALTSILVLVFMTGNNENTNTESKSANITDPKGIILNTPKFGDTLKKLSIFDGGLEKGKDDLHPQTAGYYLNQAINDVKAWSPDAYLVYVEFVPLGGALTWSFYFRSPAQEYNYYLVSWVNGIKSNSSDFLIESSDNYVKSILQSNFRIRNWKYNSDEIASKALGYMLEIGEDIIKLEIISPLSVLESRQLDIIGADSLNPFSVLTIHTSAPGLLPEYRKMYFDSSTGEFIGYDLDTI